MEITFDELIDSYLATNVGTVKNFLSKALSAHLADNITALYADGLLLSAGTGNDLLVKHDKRIRSDKIYWLDRIHNNVYENDFFDLMDRFVKHLNSTCYTGITGYEFHYTLYEKGSFYKRHLDNFKQNGTRAFSMIMYLNNEVDGGALRIYQGNASQDITPNAGKSVFFKSNELEHEVLVTHLPRMSITGWLKIAG
ncbi:SM-20-related protein [Mucilaginibacter frigoritolerans]|uniref:SM-20-related protein n=1 Tax=Mucilaginibacter frigoritolerans TaxID=652788 RepID=A0A562TNW7_9SPHI|nr:2OG-Fe(II) oxygenase [Mucilaginibacter frigoritolerans]TWI94806.1 SM-20-related protein [Mucilaginibacter frigoritolerans]